MSAILLMQDLMRKKQALNDHFTLAFQKTEFTILTIFIGFNVRGVGRSKEEGKIVE